MKKQESDTHYPIVSGYSAMKQILKIQQYTACLSVCHHVTEHHGIKQYGSDQGLRLGIGGQRDSHRGIEKIGIHPC